ncbi:MAG: hypothetical protein EZS28_034822 [Streblomastix strix]|uniref:Uncharacterized protein n=1 Tax=Streblomastix strix TaxID=222440 RepID=A0A5J4UHT7_9EUKA|nr:MAG: hypothetical protein EZS28_034822 [Streblomastix strix]
MAEEYLKGGTFNINAANGITTYSTNPYQPPIINKAPSCALYYSTGFILFKVPLNDDYYCDLFIQSKVSFGIISSSGPSLFTVLSNVVNKHDEQKFNRNLLSPNQASINYSSGGTWGLSDVFNLNILALFGFEVQTTINQLPQIVVAAKVVTSEENQKDDDDESVEDVIGEVYEDYVIEEDQVNEEDETEYNNYDEILEDKIVISFSEIYAIPPCNS